MTETVATGPRPYIEEAGFAVTRPGIPAGDPATWARLSSNESSYGASSKALAAAVSRAASLQLYPDPNSAELKATIARTFDLAADQIVCGNGSEAIIENIGRCYARPGDEILFGRYAFIQFRIFAERLGATAVLAAEDDYTIDIDALLAAVTDRTKIIFLANPNNPTGTYVPISEIRRLRDTLRNDVVLVIDSAYAEFADQPDYSAGHELVDGTQNVIVARTFSKAYGLAALRVGWAHGSPSMIRVLNRMKQIGNVNALAQAAAVAGLEDQDFVDEVVARTVATRHRVAGALGQLGLRPLPSQGNFLCVEFPDETHTSAAAYEFLMQRGVMTRRIEDYGLGSFLRIGVGTDDEMNRVIDGLAAFLAVNPAP